MSYRCEKCGEAQSPRSQPNHIVTKRYPDGNIAKEENHCDHCISPDDTSCNVTVSLDDDDPCINDDFLYGISVLS